MENLQIFNNEEFGQVRTAIINEEPWFCLMDICRALEIKNPSDTKKRLNPKGIATTDTITAKGIQNLLYINEPNLYKTIFQSRKESAERFKAERKGGEGRMVGDDLISRMGLMDSLRGNVLVDVTPALEEAIGSQPAACDIDGIVARVGTAMGQLEEAMGIAFE